VAASLVLVACGSSSGSSSSAATTPATSTAAPASSSGTGDGTVDLADNSALGTKILVDSQGRTLYLFEQDTSADQSTCSDACAASWPPFTTKGATKAGSGVDSSQLTTLKRDDGSTQVAYAGHPLYYYSGDSAPGDANGNGIDEFGAEWYAMDSSGASVEGGESEDSGSDSSSDDSTSEDSGSTSTSDDSSSGYSPSY
jgi:predicted lipoprotein with Yx(FWY)xxD motif